jgi:NAD(P)-dependent dehydrogenase (short-subunit alcohol dehydrogenase family)/acyl carrier protein
VRVAAPIEVAALILEIVAEATGYPAETLAPEMDLEADLGIDSIKRVEILSMVSRRVPGAPSVDPEKLSSLRTLRDVAAFVERAGPPVPVAALTPAAAPSTDSRGVLLSTVAELTGYPIETLQLSMDLEADLGIDSIKRVEILSLLSRRIPGAPSVNPEKLSALKTLDQVLAFVQAAAPREASAPELVKPPVAGQRPDAAATVLATVSELTGYPVETLNESMDLEADLGIDSIKRVEILSLLSRKLPGAPSVDPEKLSGLRTLKQVTAFVGGGVAAAPMVAPKVITPVVQPQRTVARVTRRVVVPVRAKPPTSARALPEGRALITTADAELAKAIAKLVERSGRQAQLIDRVVEVSGPVAALILTAPHASGWADGELQLKEVLRAARAAGPALRAAPGAAVLAVSRRDGALGFGRGAQAHPLAGALNGLVKTLALEWPDVRCRTLDLSAQWSLDEAAQVAMDELEHDGPSELGIGPAGRVTLASRELPERTGELPLGAGDVVIVTGGARGVTADCARSLAEASGATLLLLGRSAAPAEEASWLSAATDEAAIKKLLLERAAPGSRPTPRQLATSAREILAARDIRTTLASAAAAGVTVRYRQVDVRDEAAVKLAVDDARATLGPIRAVVHGAGVLRDKRIEDKRDDDFAQVLDPKLAGLRAILEATRSDELRAIALFASVSGRFGRKGQTDYALANQGLVSIALNESARRPDCRVVALDWGPWAGGMVTPALEAAFTAEGVGLIPLETGAKLFVDELRGDAGGAVEVVIGAGFGDSEEAGWSLSRAVRVERSWPVLADHRLSGREVLPLALTIEWFAQAARQVADGSTSIELDDVRVLRGVTLETDREELGVWTGRPEARGDLSVVPVELRNRKDVVHVRAQIVLGAASAGERLRAPSSTPFTTPVSELYASQLFHGPSLWALRSIESLGEDGMAFTVKTHATSERMIPGPAQAWTVDPLCLDGVFQALIVWARAIRGAPSLPSRVGAVKIFGAFAPGDAKAVVRVRSIEGSIVTSDIELFDASGALAVRIDGYECTVSGSLNKAFAADPQLLHPTTLA